MLDAVQMQPVPETPVSLGSRAAKIKRRIRLLLAEDDGPFRDMLVWAFEDAGCEVVAVGNGTDLRELLASSLPSRAAVKPFDIVVTDVRMPGWTGLHAIESLTGAPDLPPIVVMTAFGDEETKDRAKKAGAIAVLDKPIDPAVLCALVHEVAL